MRQSAIPVSCCTKLACNRYKGDKMRRNHHRKCGVNNYEGAVTSSWSSSSPSSLPDQASCHSAESRPSAAVSRSPLMIQASKEASNGTSKQETKGASGGTSKQASKSSEQAREQGNSEKSTGSQSSEPYDVTVAGQRWQMEQNTMRRNSLHRLAITAPAAGVGRLEH